MFAHIALSIAYSCSVHHDAVDLDQVQGGLMNCTAVGNGRSMDPNTQKLMY